MVMRWIRVMVVAVGVAALAWLPSGSKAQPDHAGRGPATTVPARGDRNYHGSPLGVAERLPRWDFGPVPELEVEKAMAFLKENSPRRFEVMDNMMKGAGPRFPMR